MFQCFSVQNCQVGNGPGDNATEFVTLHFERGNVLQQYFYILKWEAAILLFVREMTEFV